MSLSMSHASLPVFLHYLGTLSDVLKKGEAYVKARGMDENVVLQTRLYPDMFPLVKQVQIACDFSKGCSARLSDTEIPSFEDNETSFAQLLDRVAKTRDFIATIDAAKVDGTEEKNIELSVGGYDLQFQGQEYLLNFVLPNFYFHLTTTYSILRHIGVEVGKMDFVGGIEKNLRKAA